MRRTLSIFLALVFAGLTVLPTPAHAGTTSGKILFMNQGFSLVITELQTPFTCSGNPTTQGTDGYVLTIPGAEKLTVTTRWDWDYDLGRAGVSAYFLDPTCRVLGSSLAKPGDDDVPAGTHYAVIHLGYGFDVTFNATWS